jgi:hypothetical protein
MTGPRRWVETEEASPEVLALLRHARPSRPLDDGVRERSRRRVAALSALPVAAGAFFWMQHLALGAALGVVVTSAALVLPRALSHRDPVASVPKANAPRTAPARPERSAVTEAPVARVTPPPDAAPVERTPLPGARAADGEAQGLTREARLLERARALVSQSPSGALGALQRHEAEFPHGTLELERDLLKVEALVHLGRRAEAEKVARAIRARAPGNLYERRLARLLGASP